MENYGKQLAGMTVPQMLLPRTESQTNLDPSLAMEV
jgi:hypothetical protein